MFQWNLSLNFPFLTSEFSIFVTLNPCASGGLIWPILNDAKNPEKWLKPWQMGTHLRVLSESYPMNTNMIGFEDFLRFCAFDKSRLSIKRVKWPAGNLTHWHSERPKQAWLFCWYFPHKGVFIKNIWRRNVYQNITNNSPSNILWEFALFPSYFQKYENSRRYFPGELWVRMG